MDGVRNRGHSRLRPDGNSQQMFDSPAEAAISVFAVSTYDTDYFLVRRQSAAAAMDAWRAGGLVI